jgi:hypothetical protein
MIGEPPRSELPAFARCFLDPATRVTAIGSGSPGGKARGLMLIRDLLADRVQPSDSREFLVEVPALTVLQTDMFDRFMSHNGFWPFVRSEHADAQIALKFQTAELPPELVGDLRALIEEVRSPLAVRSSSLLEDARQHPFAGVYTTKMIPNDQHNADARFRRLAEAVKLVYASLFFEAARRYIAAAGLALEDEKMAVIIQEVVGRRHGGRFYPDVSGVARSYSYYRSGNARPEDGFVSLALGLGKTIVDGGITWTYSPAYPRATPPFATARELLNKTQTTFWAVSMGGTPRYDPVAEVEYLVQSGLGTAEEDGTLRYTASSYDPGGDRLHPGARADCLHALTFAPLLVLEEFPLNRVVRELMAASQAAVGAPVEIEFAMTFAPDSDRPARLGFLQVRPMLVSSQPVSIAPDEFDGPRCLVASDAVMGNGFSDDVADIVFVRPDTFDTMRTRAIAAAIASLNRDLVAVGRPYLLLGFGRWGSSDPSLGIPVDWSSIAGARAIVETSIGRMDVDPSQGSHFFHNLSSFGVTYFAVRPEIDRPVDWEWLARQPVAADTEYVRHVSLQAPLQIKVDGRSARGVVLKPAGDAA